MNSEEIAGKLAKLAPREKQVLHLKCQGLKYRDIAPRLGIKVATVKAHMSHVYDKLGLSELELSDTQLWDTLFKVYCPALQQTWIEVTEPGPEARNDAALEPSSSDRTIILVSRSDDLVPWQRPGPPATPQQPPAPGGLAGQRQLPGPETPQRPAGPNTCLVLLSGIALGALLMIIVGGVVWWLTTRNANAPTKGVATATATIIAATQTQVAAPPTAAPALATVIVIVTATPEPVTNTPEPTGTPQPTLTSTPAFVLPFSDNFDNGLKPQWTVLSGNPIIASGRLEARNETLELSIGDGSLSNYTLSFDYVGDFGEDFALYLGPSWQATVSGFNQESCFKACENGGYQTKQCAPRGDPGKGNIKLIVSGDHYSMYFDELPVIDFQYPTGSTVRGPIRLDIFASGRRYLDNFQLSATP